MGKPVYCGNNRRHSSLRTRSKKIGTRYECLKQGIGVGLNLLVDPEYDGEYIPIDTRKIYCGNSRYLPGDYDIIGSNSMCLQKGVGIGKNLKVKKSKKKSKRKSKKKRKSK
jgi:hypothetical protein